MSALSAGSHQMLKTNQHVRHYSCHTPYSKPILKPGRGYGNQTIYNLLYPILKCFSVKIYLQHHIIKCPIFPLSAIFAALTTSYSICICTLYVYLYVRCYIVYSSVLCYVHLASIQPHITLMSVIPVLFLKLVAWLTLCVLSASPHCRGHQYILHGGLYAEESLGLSAGR